MQAPDSEVDFLVVGGGECACFALKILVNNCCYYSGVVGLAVAQRLSARFLSASTYLVERHQIAGQEIR